MIRCDQTFSFLVKPRSQLIPYCNARGSLEETQESHIDFCHIRVLNIDLFGVPSSNLLEPSDFIENPAYNTYEQVTCDKLRLALILLYTKSEFHLGSELEKTT